MTEQSDQPNLPATGQINDQDGDQPGRAADGPPTPDAPTAALPTAAPVAPAAPAPAPAPPSPAFGPNPPYGPNPAYGPGFAPGYAPMPGGGPYPGFAPVDRKPRVPWINPARRTAVLVASLVAAIVLLGAGTLIGWAVTPSHAVHERVVGPFGPGGNRVGPGGGFGGGNGQNERGNRTARPGVRPGASTVPSAPNSPAASSSAR